MASNAQIEKGKQEKHPSTKIQAGISNTETAENGKFATPQTKINKAGPEKLQVHCKKHSELNRYCK